MISKDPEKELLFGAATRAQIIPFSSPGLMSINLACFMCFFPRCRGPSTSLFHEFLMLRFLKAASASLRKKGAPRLRNKNNKNAFFHFLKKRERKKKHCVESNFFFVGRNVIVFFSPFFSFNGLLLVFGNENWDFEGISFWQLQK